MKKIKNYPYMILVEKGNYRGYTFVVTFNVRFGEYNGYIVLPKVIPALLNQEFEDIDVHGGIDYNKTQNNYPIEGENVHAIGFNCGHSRDLTEETEKINYLNQYKSISEEKKKKIWEYYKEDAELKNKSTDGNPLIIDLKYVRKQCKRLIDQLINNGYLEDLKKRN